MTPELRALGATIATLRSGHIETNMRHAVASRHCRSSVFCAGRHGTGLLEGSLASKQKFWACLGSFTRTWDPHGAKVICICSKPPCSARKYHLYFLAEKISGIHGNRVTDRHESVKAAQYWCGRERFLPGLLRRHASLGVLLLCREAGPCSGHRRPIDALTRSSRMDNASSWIFELDSWSRMDASVTIRCRQWKRTDGSVRIPKHSWDSVASLGAVHTSLARPTKRTSTRIVLPNHRRV